MSLLLDSLHQRTPLPSWAPPPAQPLPRGSYPTAKWPEGCTHLPQPGLVAGGFVRPQWLIDANKAAHTEGINVKWHLVATDHEATIRSLAERVNVAEGHNLRAARGCSLAYLTFGPLEVAVEYEFEPASGDGWNEPRCEASVSVLRVYLNGYWCDAADVASEDQISKWEVSIMEGGEQ